MTSGRTKHKKVIHLGKSLKGVVVHKKKPKGAIKQQDTKNIKYYFYRGKEIAVPRRGVKVIRD